MEQVDENLQRLFDDRMRPLTFDMDDEAHATRIVFVGGIVQSLGGGQSWDLHTAVIGYSAAISKRNLQMPSMRTASVLVMHEAHGSYSVGS
jgi:hypothetical protein